MPIRSTKPDLSRRCALLDSLRGLTVINMVLFHAMYDWDYIFGFPTPRWYEGIGGFVWQQAICCTFITLSGFCAAMGKHTVRRGLIVSAMGLAVTLVTLLFMREELILFGVLTLIGACMLLVGLAKSYLLKVPAKLGLPAAFLLFALTRNINRGSLGLFFHPILTLPRGLYHDYVTAFFGFPQPGFLSSDYFSLIPWLFLFLTGFYLHGLCGKQILAVKWKGIRPLNFIGRHALEIYMIHQPAVYGLLYVFNLLTAKLGMNY